MSTVQLRSIVREYIDDKLSRELALVQGSRAPDRERRLAALREAAAFFTVSRCFPRTFDEGQRLPRLAPALDVLDRCVPGALDESKVGPTVRELSHELGACYGGTQLLSAATKFLWLRHPDKAIIHDSQAQRALGVPAGDYDAFIERWRAQYDAQRDHIASICTAVTRDRDPSVRQAASQEWFYRRAFDLSLWRKGTRS